MSTKKILIVEDEQALSQTISNILRMNGYETIVAPNGREGKELVVLDDFDLVISDIRMPQMTGIELLNFINLTKPVPVILMTGFSEISETKEAYEIGAKGFLAKPFTKKELIEQVDFVLSGFQQPMESLDGDYVGLKIDEFISGNEIKYDIFLRINKSKYIKVANCGESIDLERVKTYNSLGLTHLYLRKEDFRAYCGFTVSFAEKVSNSQTLNEARKVKIIQDTSKSILCALYHDNLDEKNFNLATNIVKTSLNVLCESSDTLKLIDSLRVHDDHLFSHSMAVSLYATLLANELGFTSIKTRTLVSICGLFHDIGLKQIPKEIADKPLYERSSMETKIFESHSQRGVEILSTLKNIPPEVCQVALQHHEDCQGLGYPLQLSRVKISSMAKLINAVDEFCSLAHPTNDQEAFTPSEALDRILTTNKGRIEPTYLMGLQNVIQKKQAA